MCTLPILQVCEVTQRQNAAKHTNARDQQMFFEGGNKFMFVCWMELTMEEGKEQDGQKTP